MNTTKRVILFSGIMSLLAFYILSQQNSKEKCTTYLRQWDAPYFVRGGDTLEIEYQLEWLKEDNSPCEDLVDNCGSLPVALSPNGILIFGTGGNAERYETHSTKISPGMYSGKFEPIKTDENNDFQINKVVFESSSQDRINETYIQVLDVNESSTDWVGFFFGEGKPFYYPDMLNTSTLFSNEKKKTDSLVNQLASIETEIDTTSFVKVENPSSWMSINVEGRYCDSLEIDYITHQHPFQIEYFFEGKRIKMAYPGALQYYFSGLNPNGEWKIRVDQSIYDQIQSNGGIITFSINVVNPEN